MPQNFVVCDREQELLLPPSLREWLPGDHLAWFVLAAVEELDLAAFYDAYRADGHGRAAHDPAMVVALLLYAYATGRRSSRGSSGPVSMTSRCGWWRRTSGPIARRSRAFASATRPRLRACPARCWRCAPRPV